MTVPADCSQATGNLIANCGFEADSNGARTPTSWSVDAENGNGYVSQTTNGRTPHSGSRMWYEGAISSPQTLSQTVAGTQQNSSYQVSWWSRDWTTGGTRSVAVTISNVATGSAQTGTSTLYTSSGEPQDWTQHTYTFTTGPAGTAAPVLNFVIRNDPSYTGIDDVIVVPVLTPQSITFAQPSAVTYGAAPLTLGATASSGLTVGYAVSGPCSVSGSTLTITGAGSCVITASQPGNSTYAAATSVQRTLTINKANQTISFPSLSGITYGQTPPSPSATSSSGGPVTYSSTTPSVCTISGSTITVTNKGTCTIAADQAGNSDYNAAPQVTRSFVVTGRTASLSKIGGGLGTAYTTTVTDAATGAPLTGGQVSYYGTSGFFCTAQVVRGTASCSVPASARGRILVTQLTRGFGVTGVFSATGYTSGTTTNGLPGAPAVVQAP